MPLSLLVRTDAGQEIGAGHVMRCLALAEECRSRGGRVNFVCAELPDVLEERLTDAPCDVVRLDGGAGGTQDALATLHYCHRFQPDWVVVDGYQFPAAYQQQLRATGTRLMVIDDDGRAGHYVADLVLNQNLQASADLYPNRATDSRLLLGSRYALLRKEIREPPQPDTGVAARAQRILITFGASDRHNLSSFVLRCLAAIGDPQLEVVVVAGATNPHLASLRSEARRLPIGVEIVENPPSIVRLMDWADLAVTAGGSTCWELAYRGVPMVVIVVAENQAAIAAALENSGGQVSLGWYKRLSDVGVRKQLSSLLDDNARRQQMANSARQLIDGRGCERVVRELGLTISEDDEVRVSGQQPASLASP